MRWAMKGANDAYRGDAAVSARDREAPGAQVVFYQLTRKFVDDARSVPEDAQSVLYYTLAVGHHTGVIDCFEERLRSSLEAYERVLDLLGDAEDARYKLAGILRGGEVQIDRSHVASLQDAVARAAAVAPPADGGGPGEEGAWLAAFAELLEVLAADGTAYIMGRRREA